MSAPTLYQLGEEFRALDELLDEQREGTVADLEAVSAWFAELEGALEQKLQRCIAWAAAEEALAAAAKVEAKRLTTLAKRREANVERLKRAVMALFEAQGIKRIDTPLGAVRLVKNGGSPPVLVADGVDLMELPEGCWRAVIEPVREELRARLKAGEEIPGVSFGSVGARIELG